MYGDEHAQMKALVPAQAEAEQAEASAHGQVEARGHGGKAGVGKFVRVTAGRGVAGRGVNVNNRKKGVSKKKQKKLYSRTELYSCC